MNVSGWLRRGVLLIALVGLALAQRGGFRFEDDDNERPMPERKGEFHFLRVEYTDLPQYHRNWGYSSRDGRGSGWWIMDWPAAENHFTHGVERLTRVDAGNPTHVRLTDPKLFEYPWIYATQTGWWGLSDAETKALREYLLRGGFLVVDDFWGAEQWDVFQRTMARVLPGEEITDIDLADSVMHVLFEIRQQDLTFIPGSRHLRRGPDGRIVVVQPPGTEPAWRAMRDAKGRILVAVNYNTDIADAWEFADVPYYPEKMTSLAYRYGINYLLYALTH